MQALRLPGTTQKLIAPLVALAAALVVAAPASADVVTNANDAGAGSLRAAVASTAAGGTVTFDPAVTGTITLTTGEIFVDKTLTIAGPGARSLTVSGNNASRIFLVAGAGVTLTIQKLTIANGQTPDGGFEQGGAVISGNGASVVVEDSAVVNNTAGPATFGAEGGGLFVEGGGSLTVRRSVLSGNRAMGESTGSASGGAISSDSCGDGGLTVENSTVAGNSATSEGSSDGGGIDAFGSIAISNTTIAFNTVDGQFQQRGGGVFSSVDCPATREIQASIIAANQIVGGAAGASNDCDFLSDTIDGSDNVIGDPAECDLNGTNNVLGTAAPGLNPLANNGGPTNTVSLTESSPALNHVAGANCPPPAIDQRGRARPVAGACDSGAWEGQIGFTLTPTSHDYGNVQLPATTSRAAMFRVAGPTQRFTVTNTADLTVNLASIAVNNGQYAIVPSSDPGACGATIGPGATCFVDVQFNPTVAGTANAVLSVVSSNAGTLTATLTGTATQTTNPITPNDPCAPDRRAPKVTITSDQKRTLYGVGQSASITTRASDASGLTSNPSRKGQKLATNKAGTFTVRKTARDKCDNNGAATFRYRVVAPPKASIVHQAAPTGCRTRLMALAKIDSPVGLKASQIFIDGKLKVSSTKPILRARVLTRQLSNGSHTMVVSAIDTLGRKVTARGVFVISCSNA